MTPPFHQEERERDGVLGCETSSHWRGGLHRERCNLAAPRGGSRGDGPRQPFERLQERRP